jgi:ATP-dependent Clp protease ATP-binding subunit ClpA
MAEIEHASAAEEKNTEPPMVKEEVGADDIAEVISSWTGIPAGRMLDIYRVHSDEVAAARRSRRWRNRRPAREQP